MVSSSQCEGVCPAHYKRAWPTPSLSCPIPSHNRRKRKANKHRPERLGKGELGTLPDKGGLRSGLPASTASHTSRAHAQGHQPRRICQPRATLTELGRPNLALPKRQGSQPTVGSHKPVTDPVLLRMPMVVSKGKV